MVNKTKIAIAFLLLCAVSDCTGKREVITTGTLIEEMKDLLRLSSTGGMGYKALQFSSCDRRSIKPSYPGWFANEDRFGGEPLPGFEEVLNQPDSSGEIMLKKGRNELTLRLSDAGDNRTARIDFVWIRE